MSTNAVKANQPKKTLSDYLFTIITGLVVTVGSAVLVAYLISSKNATINRSETHIEVPDHKPIIAEKEPVIQRPNNPGNSSENGAQTDAKKKEVASDADKKNEQDAKKLTEEENKTNPGAITVAANPSDYPYLNQDNLNQTGNRVLTDNDKQQLRERLTDLTRHIKVRYQRGNNEARDYANDIVTYVRTLGFSAGPLFYSPPARGRFDISEKDMGRTRVYNIDVLVRVPDSL